MLNQRILNYKIIREIGSGGMATVYEAVHTKLDNTVAIKILDPVFAANEGIRLRFMQEAKIMASLNHVGITKVLDFDEEDNHLAIIMEYLDGQTLDDYVKEKGALNKEKSIEIFLPILKAFEYAHGKGIVHRDVKPSNIFITKAGKIKIMDFGIAKLVEDGASALTQTGTQMGTPVYMSPEQVHDSKNIDHRTDIYSLGVTLWFMLASKPPYNSNENSSFQIFTKIVNTDLPEHKDFPKLNDIIKKATCKKPDDRIENCKSFIRLFNSTAHSVDIINSAQQDLVQKSSKTDSGSFKQKSTFTPKETPTLDKTIVEKSKESITVNPQKTFKFAKIDEKQERKNRSLIPLLSLGAVAMIVLLFFILRPNEQENWQTAQEQSTIVAYERYLADYPQGVYTKLAKQAINEIANQSQINYDSFTDARDGRTYKTIKIGKQTWMAENLNYVENNGRQRNITDETEWENNKNYDGWCYYENSLNNGKKYGTLYQWEAAKNASPSGWHLPTDAEWDILINYLGGKEVAGGKLKATSGWVLPNIGATNGFGFSSFPGGMRYGFGPFSDLGRESYFWSSTESSTTGAAYTTFVERATAVWGGDSGDKANGGSVRCIRD